MIRMQRAGVGQEPKGPRGKEKMADEKGLKSMRESVVEYRRMLERARNEETVCILDRLAAALDEVIASGYWIEKTMEDVNRGSFNSLGALQATATQYDVAVGKCAVLLQLLPEDVRERFVHAARA